MPSQVIKALKILEHSGYKAYIVGGCVRDSILNKVPSDWDIATSALPDQVKACFLSYRVVDTGIKHGTVSVLLDGLSLEITTFRIDGQYSDARHPEAVVFTNSIKDDLYRRDFTINAMAYSNLTGLVDPFGGIADIKNKIIRCVGNPYDRFGEDALRILRMFRFSAQLKFSIHDDSLNASIKCKDLLHKISKERISMELDKILISDNPRYVLKLLSSSGIMTVIIPEWENLINFDQRSAHHDRTVDNHIIDAVCNCENDYKLRLALLLHDIGKPDTFTIGEDGRGHCYGHEEIGAEMAKNILKKMRYDNKTINTVYNLIIYHDKILTTKYSVGKVMCELGHEDFHRLIQLKRADALAHVPESAKFRLAILEKTIMYADEIYNENIPINLSSLNINGNHIKEIGVKEGKEIGYILDKLLSMVILGEIKNEYDCLKIYAEKILNSGDFI